MSGAGIMSRFRNRSIALILISFLILSSAMLAGCSKDSTPGNGPDQDSYGTIVSETGEELTVIDQAGPEILNR